jgi:ribosomal protein L32
MCAAAAATAAAVYQIETDAKRQIDHRTLPRKKRREFRHQDALKCIQRDYLGIMGDPTITPLFGTEFKLMFRISKGRFQVLMEDLMASNYSFYKTSHMDGFQRTSIEARLLLPLKTMAYGVPHHTFIDYFQMSEGYARECCKHFCKALKLVYSSEYLRCPTKRDMKRITKLHKAIHQTDGLFGSLDCTHTYWKNCPKAWQGTYKGKEEKASIVLEAVADYHLFFWHASYGYTGTMNDINILSLSPLMGKMLDGSLHDLETESGVVPFMIEEEQFTRVFFLVDGIYPSFSRFVRGIKHPITEKEKRYTAWQEACRKDIERAFGVLKATWQCLERSILLHSLDDISERVACCLLLHNMIVTDRVMAGDGYNYRRR